MGRSHSHRVVMVKGGARLGDHPMGDLHVTGVS
jgi:hypothetical protein